MNSVSPETPASILVSEDEPLVRTYLSDVLGQSGFRVIVAANGEDALALAKRENVCVVISDVAMPGPINGFETLLRLVRKRATTIFRAVCLNRPNSRSGLVLARAAHEVC